MKTLKEAFSKINRNESFQIFEFSKYKAFPNQNTL